jgi:hypothetical protein
MLETSSHLPVSGFLTCPGRQASVPVVVTLFRTVGVPPRDLVVPKLPSTLSITSLPVAPLTVTTSRPPPPVTESLPAPPVTILFPAPPDSESAPTVSKPPPPVTAEATELNRSGTRSCKSTIELTTVRGFVLVRPLTAEAKFSALLTFRSGKISVEPRPLPISVLLNAAVARDVKSLLTTAFATPRPVATSCMTGRPFVAAMPASWDRPPNVSPF